MQTYPHNITVSFIRLNLHSAAKAVIRLIDNCEALELSVTRPAGGRTAARQGQQTPFKGLLRVSCVEMVHLRLKPRIVRVAWIVHVYVRALAMPLRDGGAELNWPVQLYFCRAAYLKTTAGQWVAPSTGLCTNFNFRRQRSHSRHAGSASCRLSE